MAKARTETVDSWASLPWCRSIEVHAGTCGDAGPSFQLKRRLNRKVVTMSFSLHGGLTLNRKLIIGIGSTDPVSEESEQLDGNANLCVALFLR